MCANEILHVDKESTYHTSLNNQSVKGREDLEMCALAELCEENFLAGELYMFGEEQSNDDCGDVLWGVFDKLADGHVCLESASRDMSHFDLWCRLPEGYRFYRLATRRELSDYMMGLTYCQCSMHNDFLMHL